jgi:hypothetical protein
MLAAGTGIGTVTDGGRFPLQADPGCVITVIAIDFIDKIPVFRIGFDTIERPEFVKRQSALKDCLGIGYLFFYVSRAQFNHRYLSHSLFMWYDGCIVALLPPAFPSQPSIVGGKTQFFKKK